MINHYGTTPLIRQCVTPGMMAMHEGRTYRVSAVIQERKWVYLHTDAEIIRLSDCVIDVLLDGHGNLKWFTEFGHLNRGDMLTSEQHRCHNEKKKFQRRV